MRVWLLVMLEGRPDHGYNVVARLKELGAVATPGQVYRALRFLEDAGFVAPVWDTTTRGAARRVYTVTPKGRHALETLAPRLRRDARSLQPKMAKYVLAQLRSISGAMSAFEFTVTARMSVQAIDAASARRKLERIFATPRAVDEAIRSTGRACIEYAESDEPSPKRSAPCNPAKSAVS